jgi:predicted thioesterase
MSEPSPSPFFAPSPPPVGSKGAASLVVEPQVTAKVLGSGSLDVLGTPALAALMEKAACAALSAYLAPGWTSVGTALSLKHEAASPLGAAISATAEVMAVNDREIAFRIVAEDNAGGIGSAVHTRFVVNSEKFMGKTAKRLGG